MNLKLRLVRLGDAKEAADWNLSLSMTDQLKAQKGRKLDWHFPVETREFALRCASNGQESNVKAFTEGGGVLPKAIYVRNPPYSEEARKQKLSGAQVYDVFIDENGQPVLVVPHRHVVPALDDVAVKALAEWKFQPATMNGNPVAVCLEIKVEWRLY